MSEDTTVTEVLEERFDFFVLETKETKPFYKVVKATFREWDAFMKSFLSNNQFYMDVKRHRILLPIQNRELLVVTRFTGMQTKGFKSSKPMVFQTSVMEMEGNSPNPTKVKPLRYNNHESAVRGHEMVLERVVEELEDEGLSPLVAAVFQDEAN
jgi:hypothetical protein